MGQVPRTRGVESTRAHKLAYRMPCSCRAEPGQDQEVQEAEDLQRDRGDHRDPGGSEGDVALSGLISPVQEAGQRQGAVARSSRSSRSRSQRRRTRRRTRRRWHFCQAEQGHGTPGHKAPVQEAGQRQGAVARLVPGRGAGIALRNEAVRTGRVQ